MFTLLKYFFTVILNSWLASPSEWVWFASTGKVTRDIVVCACSTVWKGLLRVVVLCLCSTCSGNRRSDLLCQCPWPSLLSSLCPSSSSCCWWVAPPTPFSVLVPFSFSVCVPESLFFDTCPCSPPPPAGVSLPLAPPHPSLFSHPTPLCLAPSFSISLLYFCFWISSLPLVLRWPSMLDRRVETQWPASLPRLSCSAHRHSPPPPLNTHTTDLQNTPAPTTSHHLCVVNLCCLSTSKQFAST